MPKRILKISLLILILFLLYPTMRPLWLPFDVNENENVLACIDRNIESGNIGTNDISSIIEYSNEITARLLSFTTESRYTSFGNLSFKNATPTHCVYYAKTFKTIFDHIARKGNLKAKCKIVRKPIEGLGFIPATFKAVGCIRMYNFTKDHDSIEIELNGEIINTDPTFYDYTHF